MLPRYFICKNWNRPSGVHVYVDLDADTCLVKVDHPATAVQAGSSRLPHIMDHESTLHPDHVGALSEHGVLHTDTCFKAIMKVALSHPDMEP